MPEPVSPATLERIYRGEIPWNVSGYWEAIGWRAELLKTPRDDWDLAPHIDATYTPNEDEHADRDSGTLIGAGPIRIRPKRVD